MRLYIHTCACVRMYACAHVRACMWSPEDSLGRYSTGAGCLLSDTGFNSSSPEWPMTLGNLPITTSSVPITHTKVCVDTLIWNRGVNSEPYPSLYSKILPTESPPWPCAPFNLIFWGLGIFMCLLFLTPWKYFSLIFYYQFSTPNSNED